MSYYFAIDFHCYSCYNWSLLGDIMKTSEYGSFSKIHNINLNSVACIIEEGFNCKTYMIGGKELCLSWSDMRPVLDRFPEVYSYELYQSVRVNPQAISDYLEDGLYVDITLNNGIVLKELSLTDFERRILPMLGKEKE